MANSKKTWVSIAIAAAIIVAILAGAAIGGALMFFSRHISTQFTSTEKAADEFVAARARFSGQQPLIEMRPGEAVVRREQRAAASDTRVDRQLETLHVLAYDRGAGKLVRVNVPFWLLRLAPSRHVRFTNRDRAVDSEQVHVT